jgi:hypothetical protein
MMIASCLWHMALCEALRWVPWFSTGGDFMIAHCLLVHIAHQSANSKVNQQALM